MKRFREKHPLLASLMILAVMFAGLPAGSVLVGIAVAVPPLTEFLGDYGIQLLAELSMLVVMVLMTFLWKMERVFTCRAEASVKVCFLLRRCWRSMPLQAWKV